MAAEIDTHSAAAAPSARGSDDPVVDASELAGILERGFGVTALSVRSVGSESAAVFRVRTSSGPDIALKVFPSDAASGGTIRWQHEVVQRVSECGIPVARPLATRAGELTLEARSRDRMLLVQASEWLPGSPLEHVPVTHALLHEVGLTAARLHGCLRRESAPRGLVPHIWQLTSSRPTIEAALGRIALLRRQGLLNDHAAEIVRLERAAAAVFALLDAEVAPRLDRLPSAVVHHDLHDSNLLVGPAEAPRAITGILDFGDMTRSVRISEPVIAGAYAARHVTDPRAALDTVLTGWSDVVPVTSDESAVVLPLAAARLIANATVWLSRLDTLRGEYAAARRRGSLATAEALLAAEGGTRG
ncbi:phosphotransferase [Microbacterium oleivorans]|uniref:phosphotransferase n=1 Tax=Microbacterium oleivorans TaxID=273677 RepID=UPI00203B6663|nr:phosphotransferase [Microbacterium oleivorans]MCM3695103.1 phosphotransferase [Microbacterium oleivorans]